MKKILILAITALLIVSCASQKRIPQAIATPILVFEKDGTKVYRFYDKGMWIYFSTCGTFQQH